MKEQLVWACECGATIKYSDSQQKYTAINNVSRSFLDKVIQIHKDYGHETVEPYQASAIRRELKKCPAARN